MRLLKQSSLLLLLLCVAIGVAVVLEVRGRLEQPQKNLPDRTGLADESPVVLSLFPNSPESDYIRGANAKFLRYDLAEARRYFERAISTGIKSHEDLLYDYAVVLFLSGADSAEIDAAVATWRKNAPNSTRLDPREFIPRFPEWLQAGSVRPMSLSPDGRVFAIAGDGGLVTLLAPASGDRASVVTPPDDDVQHLFGFAASRGLFAAGNSEGLVVVLDVKNLKVTNRLVGHTAGVLCAEFSPKGMLCATGSLDHTIRLWTLDTDDESQLLTGHTRPVSSLSFSPNGNRLASGCWDGSIRLWNLKRGNLKTHTAETVSIKGHSAVITQLAFSHYGKWLASSSRDGLVRIWDVSTGELRHELKGHTGPVSAVAFSPNDRLLVTGGGDNSVLIWDTTHGKLIKSHEAVSTEGVSAVAFTPDGSRIIVSDFTGSVGPLNVPRQQ